MSQKTFGFLIFSGGIEMGHWSKINERVLRVADTESATGGVQ